MSDVTVGMNCQLFK